MQLFSSLRTTYIHIILYEGRERSTTALILPDIYCRRHLRIPSRQLRRSYSLGIYTYLRCNQKVAEQHSDKLMRSDGHAIDIAIAIAIAIVILAQYTQ